jgi:multimeric flavodoxin WrbA
MNKILAINGSYRKGGITDQVVEVMAGVLEDRGVEVETILLRASPIEFCQNCRACTQPSGSSPGECMIQDGMQDMIAKIEGSHGYILASPTNFGSTTAVFARFMERLAGYAYWPWGAAAPKLRKAGAVEKKAVLVSSCAAPGIMGRWSFNTRKQLKTTARTLGAATAGVLFTGLVAREPRCVISDRVLGKARTLASRLA